MQSACLSFLVLLENVHAAIKANFNNNYFLLRITKLKTHTVSQY